MELEPMEIMNTKTSSAFLKRGKYKNETFLLDIFFFRIESILRILKKIINILSIYLHHLRDVLDKKSVRFNSGSLLKKYTEKFTLANSHAIIFRKS